MSTDTVSKLTDSDRRMYLPDDLFDRHLLRVADSFGA